MKNGFLISNPLPDFPTLAARLVAIVGTRYFLFAGFAWLLCYVWMKRRWFHRKIVQRTPASQDLRRELLYSLASTVIFGIIAAATFTVARHGHSRMYWKMDERGWGWFVLSIAAAIFIHDTYFYWTHRLMHHPRLFRWFHRTHHLSTNPTPWASYSFDPPEAVVQAGILPLIAWTLPIHPLAFGLFMFWQITINVAGHTGFEFHPRWLMETPLRLLLNTPTNHVMHHETMRGNYGLYFNLWDRLMATNHRDYERRYREVTSRPAPQ